MLHQLKTELGGHPQMHDVALRPLINYLPSSLLQLNLNDFRNCSSVASIQLFKNLPDSSPNLEIFVCSNCGLGAASTLQEDIVQLCDACTDLRNLKKLDLSSNYIFEI